MDDVGVDQQLRGGLGGVVGLVGLAAHGHHGVGAGPSARVDVGHVVGVAGDHQLVHACTHTRRQASFEACNVLRPNFSALLLSRRPSRQFLRTQ